MAHTLIHWRYDLNEWIIDYLKRKGIFSDNEILEREHWSQKKRTKYANQVVDDMEEGGEINRLWRDFSTNLKAARETKVRSFYILPHCLPSFIETTGGTCNFF